MLTEPDHNKRQDEDAQQDQSAINKADALHEGPHGGAGTNPPLDKSKEPQYVGRSGEQDPGPHTSDQLPQTGGNMHQYQNDPGPGHDSPAERNPTQEQQPKTRQQADEGDKMEAGEGSPSDR